MTARLIGQAIRKIIAEGDLEKYKFYVFVKEKGVEETVWARPIYANPLADELLCQILENPNTVRCVRAGNYMIIKFEDIFGYKQGGVLYENSICNRNDNYFNICDFRIYHREF